MKDRRGNPSLSYVNDGRWGLLGLVCSKGSEGFLRAPAGDEGGSIWMDELSLMDVRLGKPS
jgi:hypothetical protein